jgi:hypothetical protein
MYIEVPGCRIRMTVTPSFSPENNHWQKCSVVFGPANTNSFFPHVWQILSLSTPWSMHFKHTLCTTHILGLCSKAPHLGDLQWIHFPLSFGWYAHTRVSVPKRCETNDYCQWCQEHVYRSTRMSY